MPTGPIPGRDFPPKPVNPVLIRSHPIAQGLILDCALTEGFGHATRDLVRPDLVGQFIGSSFFYTWAQVPGGGQAIDTSPNEAAGGHRVQYGPARSYVPTQAFADSTVEVLYKHINSTGNIVGNLFTASGVSNQISLANSPGSISYSHAGNSFFMQTDSDHGVVFDLDRWYHIIGRKTGSTIDVWINGIEASYYKRFDPTITLDSSTWTPVDPSATFQLNITPDGFGSKQQTIFALARFWLRGLQPDEMIALFSDPWRIWQSGGSSGGPGGGGTGEPLRRSYSFLSRLGGFGFVELPTCDLVEKRDGGTNAQEWEVGPGILITPLADEPSKTIRFEIDPATFPTDLLPTGPTGPPGSMGPMGPIGMWGEDGEDSEPILIPGPKGDTGPQGPPGAGGEGSGVTVIHDWESEEITEYVPVAGPKGAKGDTGATGPPGAPGGTGTVQQTDVYSATASQTVFTATQTPISGSTIYVVAAGVVLSTSAYSVSGTTLTLTDGVAADTIVIWAYYVAMESAGTQIIESFTASADQTDFVLTNTPMASGLTLVSSAGVIVMVDDPWSLIAPKTIRFVTGRPSGTEVTVSYRY